MQKVKQLTSEILSCNRQAMEHLRNGHSSKASELLNKAEKRLIEGPPLPDAPKFWAITLNNLGCYYKRTGKPVIALHYLKKALEIEKKNPTDLMNLAGTYLNICAVTSQLRNHEKALSSATKAIKVLSVQTEKKETLLTALAIAHHNAGLEYTYMKQTAEAAKSFHTGWAVAKEHLGPTHPLTKDLKGSYLDALENSRCPQRIPSLATNCSRKSSSVPPPAQRLPSIRTFPRKPALPRKMRSNHRTARAQVSWAVPLFTGGRPLREDSEVFSSSYRECFLSKGTSECRPSSKNSWASASIDKGTQVALPERVSNLREEAARSIQRAWRGHNHTEHRKLHSAIVQAELKAQAALNELQGLRRKSQTLHCARRNQRHP